jgi:AbrB family looped-hinge helix DNA binding protein
VSSERNQEDGSSAILIRIKAQGAARVQVGQHGVVVLPKEIRDSYRLQPGDSLTLLDFGGIVLSPKPSQVDSLADRFAQELQDKREPGDDAEGSTGGARTPYRTGLGGLVTE